jgi:hypothetical protein
VGRIATLTGALFSFGMLTSGCSLLHMNDPNHNDKIRYSMAYGHAAKVIQEAGSELKAGHPDYDVMTFWRRHYDEEARILHDCQLYDFLKVSKHPGPDRFVIAYDKATRETYLRADLRSNENLSCLPTVEVVSDNE